MNDTHLEGARSAVGRTLSKITRRLLGLILLVVAIGLSTCQAFDAVKQPVEARQIHHTGGQ